MHETIGRLAGVASRTFCQATGMPLQGNEFERINRLAAGRDGMRAVVAGFTVDPAVPRGLPVQRLGGIVAAPMAAFVAALRLSQPRRGVLCHHRDIPMAVGAVHGKILRHRVAQALRLRPRVAVVAARRIGRDIRGFGGVVMPVHRIG